MDNLHGKLFYGNNLEVLREHFPDESVDLVYLDPPFNSNATYNVLFRDESGQAPQAQIEAFVDTWHWGAESQRALEDLLRDDSPSPQAGTLLDALVSALGTNQMTAYLAMMAIRLAELRRVLKPSGSIYLHCDPTASHYLKLLMDAVFGVEHFRNEIVWFYRRWAAAAKRFQRMHDVILFYGKSDDVAFNQLYVPTSPTRSPMVRGWNTNTYESGGERKRQIIVEDAEMFEAAVERGEVDPAEYERVVYREHDGTPAFDVFEIPILNPQAKERLSYPTQKPEALLERIVLASSNEDDLVLDPFCGCGTAMAVALKNDRRWVGVDITHLAIGLVEERLQALGATPEVVGAPEDLESARLLAAQPFQFETWAVTRVTGFRPNKRQTGDGGIDGRMRYVQAEGRGKDERTEYGTVVMQVKAGRATRGDIRAFKAAISDADADLGVFVVMDSTSFTAGMEEEAVTAGFAEVLGREYRKLQIWTIEDYFDGRLPDLPMPLGYESRRMRI